jgi:hypothetical protein
VGREIEREVTEARFAAFAEGQREMTQEDLLNAIKEVVPLKESQADALGRIEQWVNEGRAHRASSPEQQASSHGRAFTI